MSSSSAIIVLRPPTLSVMIPTGTRSVEPVSTGIAMSRANSDSLSPSSLRIGMPTIANISQTAKKIVKRMVATISTRIASPETSWPVSLSRVARGPAVASADPPSFSAGSADVLIASTSCSRDALTHDSRLGSKTSACPALCDAFTPRTKLSPPAPTRT